MLYVRPDAGPISCAQGQMCYVGPIGAALVCPIFLGLIDFCAFGPRPMRHRSRIERIEYHHEPWQHDCPLDTTETSAGPAFKTAHHRVRHLFRLRKGPIGDMTISKVAAQRTLIHYLRR
jgi:hypothetical protein